MNMIIGTLKVTCDHIERVTPIKNGQDYSALELLLDDVDASDLLMQLMVHLDPEQVLDHYPDSVLQEYLARVK